MAEDAMNWRETGFNYWMLESGHGHFHAGVGKMVTGWAWFVCGGEQQGEASTRKAAMNAAKRAVEAAR